MPNKIEHPIRDKVIRNPTKIKQVLKKELAYEKIKYEAKKNIFR